MDRSIIDMASKGIWLTDLGSVSIPDDVKQRLLDGDMSAIEHMNDEAWRVHGPNGLQRPGREVIGGR